VQVVYRWQQRWRQYAGGRGFFLCQPFLNRLED
jgi:hypothetical protein